MANTGYGRINYATANKQGQQGIVQNQQNIATDQKFKQDEIDRALSVIEARKKEHKLLRNPKITEAMLRTIRER
ncbi:hypothetical protein ACP8HI_13540 [Paenibacillus sp. FA6]|uniref:hypothetical protein n=1 Tax=Paenibacillus sp. FA6 TaxID=3413029 RepID=UPI003F65EB8C